MKKSKLKKWSPRKLISAGLATLAIVASALTFAGCKEVKPSPTPTPTPTPPEPTPNPPVVEVEVNHAGSMAELYSKYADKTQNFIGTQLDKVLTHLGIEDDLQADYTVKTTSNGITAIEYKFEYEKKNYTATATYPQTVEFDTIANYEEYDEYTEKATNAIDSSKITYEAKVILNHVTSLAELQKDYADNLKQYIAVQKSYALEQNGVDKTKVEDMTETLIADDNGVQGIKFEYTIDGTKESITVAYKTPISLDTMANYPEQEEARDEVVNKMMEAEMTKETEAPQYTDEEILSLFQDQINKNLFPVIEVCLSNYATVVRQTYDMNEISQYRWHLGEITDGKVQNLMIEMLWKHSGYTFLIAYAVDLANPTSIQDLAKEDFQLEYKKINITNCKDARGSKDAWREKYAQYVDAITENLAIKDDSFDYANATAYLRDLRIGDTSYFKIFYVLGNEVRQVYINDFAQYVDISSTEKARESALKALQEGKFDYTDFIESFTMYDNPLDYVEYQAETENSN